MEIKVRNLDIQTVKTIDKLAKNKGVSRNKFLKDLLISVAINPQVKDEKDKVEMTLTKVADALEFTHERLKSLEHNFENILLLIAFTSGIEFNEIPKILDHYITEYEEGD